MANPVAPSRTSRPLLGVAFMLGACALFPVMNGIVKFLGSHYDPKQVVWFRITTHLILVALVFLLRMGTRLFHTRHIGAQFIVSVMMLLSTLCYFTAAKYVGVADAISVSFVAPLAVVFLAWPLLGERITAIRLGAVLLGFIGVLVMVRPGEGSLQPGALVALANALTVALSILLVRRLSDSESPLMILTQFALWSTLLLAVPAIWVWRWPDAWGWTLAIGVAASATVGQYFWVQAFKAGEMSAVAPFDYLRLPFAVFTGWLISPGCKSW